MQGVLDCPADTRMVFAQAICGITDATVETIEDMKLGAGAMAYVLLAVIYGPCWLWAAVQSTCVGAALRMLCLCGASGPPGQREFWPWLTLTSSCVLCCCAAQMECKLQAPEGKDLPYKA